MNAYGKVDQHILKLDIYMEVSSQLQYRPLICYRNSLKYQFNENLSRFQSRTDAFLPGTESQCFGCPVFSYISTRTKVDDDDDDDDGNKYYTINFN